MSESTLASRFSTEHSNRESILTAARICAALTKPWVLPPQNQNPNEKLPENFQSEGSRGITNLEGKMLLALYPPGRPYFELALPENIRYAPEVSDEFKQDLEQQLFIRGLLLMSLLESANLKSGGNARVMGFRTAQRAAISQILITGETLQQFTDDYRLKVFRRDRYVTKRDSCGDVLYHIIEEEVDVKSLTPDQFEKSKLDAAIKEKDVADRMQKIYTCPEWNPQTKKWVIRQEVNGHEIGKPSEEEITPFFSTPFELIPGEDYGRGFIEQNRGDLRSLNSCSEKLLEFAATASKHLWVKDYGSQVRDTDLAKSSGGVFRGRVSGGVVQDLALLKADKLSDFRVVYDTAERLRKSLGAAMLIASEVAPKGERVTAYAWSQVVQELEGALGGVYAPISDQMQLPLLRRLNYQAEKDLLTPKLNPKAYQLRALTGLAALARASRGQDMLTFAQVAQSLGDQALAKLDVGVLMDNFARFQNLDEPGLVKTEKQRREEQAAAEQAAARQLATAKAIDVAGTIGVNAATQAISGAAA